MRVVPPCPWPMFYSRFFLRFLLSLALSSDTFIPEVLTLNSAGVSGARIPLRVSVSSLEHPIRVFE